MEYDVVFTKVYTNTKSVVENQDWILPNYVRYSVETDGILVLFLVKN